MNTAIPIWTVLAFIGGALVLNSTGDWFLDHFEFTRRGRFPRFTRRWYGTHAHVVLCSTKDDDDADRYTVLAWDGSETALPWLQVHKLNPEYLTYWDEDAEAFWAPVTDFAPYAVRRLRPYIWRFGRLPLPWFTQYLPLRQPVRYAEADA